MFFTYSEEEEEEEEEELIDFFQKTAK